MSCSHVEIFEQRPNDAAVEVFLNEIESICNRGCLVAEMNESLVVDVKRLHWIIKKAFPIGNWSFLQNDIISKSIHKNTTCSIELANLVVRESSVLSF